MLLSVVRTRIAEADRGMRPEPMPQHRLPALLRVIGKTEKRKVFGGYHPLLDETVEIDDPMPVLTTEQHNRHRRRFAGLLQCQDLRARPSSQTHQGIRPTHSLASPDASCALQNNGSGRSARASNTGWVHVRWGG